MRTQTLLTSFSVMCLQLPTDLFVGGVNTSRAVVPPLQLLVLELLVGVILRQLFCHTCHSLLNLYTIHIQRTLAVVYYINTTLS